MMSLLTVLLSAFGLAHAGATYGPPSHFSDGKSGNSPATPAGLELVEIESNEIGGRRSAYVNVPDGNGPMAVIFSFHGGRNNSGLDMVSRLDGAKNQNVLLVFPNGTRTGDKDSGWTGPDHTDDVDAMRDVHFVRALIEELDRRYDIDRKKVYAVGFSGGAYLAQWLWCQASDDIHGFFFVSRAMPIVMSQQCPARPARSVGMMLGTADDGLVNKHQMNFADTTAYISGKLECKDEPSRVTLPDHNDSTTVNHSTWSNCARDATFEFWEIEGGGHHWPGGGKPVSDKTQDVDATVELVRFFRENGGL